MKREDAKVEEKMELEVNINDNEEKECEEKLEKAKGDD